MSSQTSSRNDHFATTRWSMVMQQAEKESPVARDALEQLAQRYWYPVYACIRRCGHAPGAAAEMAQKLLEHLQGDLAGEPAQNPPGHFRRFLLDRIHDFLASDRHELVVAETTGRELVAPPDLEARYQRDGHGTYSPDDVFQRSFALEVLHRALQRLRAEARQTGHIDMYEALEPYLAWDLTSGEYEAMATRLECRPLALVMALKRLRQRVYELAAEELSDTVSSADELSREQDDLLAVLGNLNP
jgi:RNA polymerase sigma-70 factor (ECF subfamily)